MAASEQVKIIGSKNSPYCTRIEWALKLKGVEYEYIYEDVKNKSELLLKSNPIHKKIPVLLHGQVAISESLVILEYIDEKWKEQAPPLLPQDPYERAQARFWAKFADEKVIYGTWRACKEEGEGKEKAIEAVLELISFLEEQVKGTKFFGGDQIGYLDLVLGWLVMWLGVMEEAGEMKLLEADKFPFLHEWSQNFIQIPLIQECLPKREDLLNYMSASIAYVRSLAPKKP